MADGLSQLGTQVSVLALPLAAAQTLHASTLEVAALAALQTVAFVVLGLPVGAWSERMRRRPVIVIADLGRAAALGSIPLAALLGMLTIEHMYVVALSIGVFTVFFQVAHQSYVPAIVHRRDLLDANSKLEANRTVAATAGPMVAGCLVQRMTAPIAVAIDAVTFLWSAAWVARIKTADPRPALKPGARLLQQVAEGLRFVFRDRALRAIALFNGTAMTFYAAQGATEVVFLLRDVQVSASMIGLLFAGGSVGSLLGALCAARLTRAIGKYRALPLYVIVASLGALLLPLTTEDWRLALFPLGAAVSGFCLIAYNIVQISLRQATCPEHLLSRVNATMRTITTGVMPLGAMLGGLLGTWIGLRPTLWVTAVGALLACAWLIGVATAPAGGRPRESPDNAPAGATSAHRWRNSPHQPK